MKSKFLVIKDWGEFLKQLNIATIESVCVVADVMGLLKDYEKDVTKFEAEVHVSNESNYMPHLVVSSGGELDHLLTEETVLVFVVRKDKP